MRKITKAEIKRDILDFANLVREDYLPKLRSDIDKSTDTQDVKDILEERYKELQKATGNYLDEDFYIETEANAKIHDHD